MKLEKMINCKTKKWGNSLGILIPKKIKELEENQDVVVNIEKGR